MKRRILSTAYQTGIPAECCCVKFTRLECGHQYPITATHRLIGDRHMDCGHCDRNVADGFPTDIITERNRRAWGTA